MIRIKVVNAAGIHSGAKTHHHDHAIILHSFSTIKTIPSKPKNPIPLDDADDTLFIVVLISRKIYLSGGSWIRTNGSF